MNILFKEINKEDIEINEEELDKVTGGSDRPLVKEFYDKKKEGGASGSWDKDNGGASGSW
ncbi:MAG: hypothetical protein IJX90_06565 [Blautia sp.]|nr:hypothetical protein [Blautia sp.]